MAPGSWLGGGAGVEWINGQYRPYLSLFPLPCSLDCHRHEMGCRDGPRRKLTVQHPAEEAAVPRQYSHVKGISRSCVCTLGSGCTSYFQRCLSHLNIFEKTLNFQKLE